jgi:hypothetical protein
MEKTVVQFIVENIFLFLPLGITGIIITLILYLTGKKEEKPQSDDVTFDDISFGKLKVNVFLSIYLFIWITLFIIGLLSDFITPTIIGGTIAVIPLITMICAKKINKDRKVP